MTSNKHIATLIGLIDKNGLLVSQEHIQIYDEIYATTLKWSKKINITSNLSCERFFSENIIDPLLAFKSFKSVFLSATEAVASMVDLGCGGGYVGLTWLLALNVRANLTLVDSDRKKINFCKELSRVVGGKEITACQIRVEDLAKTMSEKYDLALTRATWSNKTDGFRVVRPLVRQGGSAVFFMGNSSEISSFGKELEVVDYVIEPNKIRRRLAVVHC